MKARGGLRRQGMRPKGEGETGAPACPVPRRGTGWTRRSALQSAMGREGGRARTRGGERDPLDFAIHPVLRWHLNQDHPAKGRGDAEKRLLRGGTIAARPCSGRRASASA